MIVSDAGSTPAISTNGGEKTRWKPWIPALQGRTRISAPAGNRKIDKEKSTEKVDGAVALVMALDRAMKNRGGSGCVYDERGLLILD